MSQGVPFTPDETDALKAEIIATMCEGYGMTFSGAVEKVGRVTRSIVYEWRQADPAFDTAVIKARETSGDNLLDLAENRMVATVKDATLKDHGKMVRFVLERKGRARGYAPSTDIHVAPRKKEIDPEAIANMTDEEAFAALRDITAQPATE